MGPAEGAVAPSAPPSVLTPGTVIVSAGAL